MKTLLAILMGTGFDTVAALWQPAWWLAGTDPSPLASVPVAADPLEVPSERTHDDQ
jgi:hypothetical protein